MPSDADEGVLRDILRQIDLAQQFVQSTDQERFQTDTLRLYAVTRCLEIVSEASRRPSPELKGRYAQIPWKEMAGAGNIYRHSYEDVSAQRIWDTVSLALPPLRTMVVEELASMC